MKGIVSMIELTMVLLVLITTFSILFPSFVYESKWGDAFLRIKTRDAILTADRSNLLETISFSSFRNFSDVLDDILGEKLLVYTRKIDGAISTPLYPFCIACNCTENVRKWISNFTQDITLILNGRKIDVILVPDTPLDKITACSFRTAEGNFSFTPDVLLIVGYKNLSDEVYRRSFNNFLSKGKAIIELMNFSELDDTQREIFGLSETVGSYTPGEETEVTKPVNSSSLKYPVYKYFFHFPVPIRFSTSNNRGVFKFRNSNYPFEVYKGENKVCFLNKTTGLYDICVKEKEYNLTLDGYKFGLNYIKDDTIHLSFQPPYQFVNFYPLNTLKPRDDDKEKIFLNTSSSGLPVVILNQKGNGKTAWVSDFTEDKPLSQLGDDYKLLLLSLIFSLPQKVVLEGERLMKKMAYSASYVNVVYDDMYEVYALHIGIGYPY